MTRRREPSSHRDLIRLAAPGAPPRWIVPQSTACAGGCGVRIEPAEFRLRLQIGGKNRDYHRACAVRLGVRLPS